MTTFHLIIEQVAHPETLRDINERAEELQRLKNELLNELIHLNAYRREIHAWRLSVNQQLTDINKKLASLKNQEGRLHLLEDRYTLLKFDVNLVNLENVKHDINLFSDSIANIFTNIQKIQTNIENKMINYEKSFNIELKQELRKQLNLIYENEAFLKTMLQLFKEEQEVRIKSLERNIEFLQRGNTNYLKIMGIGLAVLFVCVIWQQYQIYCLTHCR